MSESSRPRHLIALIGPAGCGKSTLAQDLVHHADFLRLRFAGNLKAMLYTFFSNQGATQEECYRYLDGDWKEIPCPYLCGQTARRAMQTLGTEWRDLIDRELWNKAWEMSYLKNSHTNSIVVDDMRFLHEEALVRKYGGKVCRIFRQGTTAGLHISEREYEKISADFTITNDQEPEDMLRQLTYIMEL